MRKKVLLLMLFLGITACVPILDSGDDYEYKCQKMTYITIEKLREGVKVSSAREIERAGKIYVYKNVLFVAEKNKGVHVIDNSDKSLPLSKAFIEIPGNIDMAVKDGYLYLDNYMDLAIIDVHNLDTIREVNRTKDVFPFDPYQSLDADIYDICEYDTSKGVLLSEKI